MKGLGRHILVELYGCDFDTLNDPNLLKPLALNAVNRSGATIMSHHFQTFEPQGVSGVVVIAESHMSFHTWPEYGYMALDYFTCGEQVDLHVAVQTMEDTLKATRTQRTLMDRGIDLGHLPHRPEDGEGAAVAAATGDAPSHGGNGKNENAVAHGNSSATEEWTTEYHLDTSSKVPVLGYQYRVDEILYQGRSALQEMVVARNPVYGRMLFLDGYMMTTETDEFVYHEMLAHVPLMLCASPRRVLIIGGGDGGLARQVLRHPSVEHIDLVEIDGEYFNFHKCMSRVSARMDDPRIHVHLEDGAAFVENTEAGTYDLVLVDSTDPIGPGKVLFEAPFFRAIRRCLKPDGVLAAQSLSPWLQCQEQKAMYRALGTVYAHVHTYLATVPSYPAGQWTFALAGKKKLDLEQFDRKRASTIERQCRYYTAALQTASFHLPRLIQENTVDVSLNARKTSAASPNAEGPRVEATP